VDDSIEFTVIYFEFKTVLVFKFKTSVRAYMGCEYLCWSVEL